jgi:shikimate kinase
MSADFLKKTNLYLVGMMGAGKTTIGHKLAHRLGYRFLDTDALIEQAAQKPITEIFATEGEAAFRTLESDVLSQVCSYTSLVVATGGGIVTAPMNWSYLRHGVVIWLDVPLNVLVSRLSEDASRPLLQNLDRQNLDRQNLDRQNLDRQNTALSAKLESLLNERRHLYEQSDICIGYEGRSIGKTCDRIIAALQQNIRLDPKLAAGKIIISQDSINTPSTALQPPVPSIRDDAEDDAN